MKTVLWALALLVMFSLPAQAANPFRAAELSDSELHELRGRYVMPGRVIHFGVTMSSVWENSAGHSVGAAASFQMNEQTVPSLYITDLSSQPADAGAQVIPGKGQVIGGNGLSDVRGISQSIRSAGDFNDGLNNLEIVVSRDGTPQTPSGTPTPWNGTDSFVSGAGRAVVERQGGGLKLMVDAGSQGAAFQQIAAGNVVQQASFTGNLNTVRNLATLSVALRDLPLGQDFANCTLEQLRALRPIGF